MKQTYQAPELEIVNLSENDILKDSVFQSIVNGTGDLNPLSWSNLVGLI